MNEIKIFYSNDWKDYELLDTGEGEKLERFGKYTFVRPYEDAFWPKTLSQEKWNKADGKFWSSKSAKGGLASLKQRESGWKMNSKNEQGESLLKKWEMEYKGIKFWAMPTPFRHLGFFPEQASHWDFIESNLQGLALQCKARPCRFLNLFGYTGVASLFALRAGAEVTHLDAFKQILNWAKENQKLSGLEKLPMRVICDDSIKFLEREIKRGNKYDAIMMDPPKFGRGPKGEVWKIEEMLPRFLSLVQKVLSDSPLFVILTSYATDSSSLALGYALEEVMKGLDGNVEARELCILEKSQNRLIPFANTAVWSASV